MSMPQEDEPREEFEGRAEGDYEVGYGKTPKEHRFQKGNKMGKGRKPGSKALKTIVKEAFGMKVKGSLGGKPAKLTKIEATIHQVATKASQGDPKAADKAIPLYERYGPPEDPEGPSDERIEANLDALEAYIAMKRQIEGFCEEEGEDDDD